MLPAAELGTYLEAPAVLRAEFACMIADALVGGERVVGPLLRRAFPEPTLDERYGREITERMREDGRRTEEAYRGRIRAEIEAGDERRLRSQQARLAMVSEALAEGFMRTVDEIKREIEAETSGPG